MRLVLMLLFCAALNLGLAMESGAPDRSFERIPFDQWLAEGNSAHFHFNATVPHPQLSFHQRVVCEAVIKLDGRDLATRLGKGELVFFVQITDASGTRYRQHGVIPLDKLDENVKSIDLQYAQRQFILPGEYRLAVVILDTATNEHSAGQLQFHIAAPRDSLEENWRGLPSVEFIANEESPESWYLPGIEGRLQWPAALASPVRLNVILNVAPASRQTPSSGLPTLLPTLKIMAQTGPAVAEHVALLDLARRRAVFDQDNVHDLDWPRLKASLSEANTASIDLHSLAERHQDAQFFVAEVRKMLRASADQPCVLVVLSKPVAFESGEDLSAISLEALPACRVFYIRYHAPVARRPFSEERMGRRGGFGGRGGAARLGSPPAAPDQLAATLKPLNPKLFDVETPEQMAKALSEIEKAFHSPRDGAAR